MSGSRVFRAVAQGVSIHLRLVGRAGQQPTATQEFAERAIISGTVLGAGLGAIGGGLKAVEENESPVNVVVSSFHGLFGGGVAGVSLGMAFAILPKTMSVVSLTAVAAWGALGHYASAPKSTVNEVESTAVASIDRVQGPG